MTSPVTSPETFPAAASPTAALSPQNQLKKLDQLAEKVLQDPAMMRKLSDRVYTLLQLDIRLQQDRFGNAQRRFQ